MVADTMMAPMASLLSNASNPADGLRTQTANVCMLRLLERVAVRFNRAGIPLMVLKGAALNLTVLDGPDERPMADIDVMIRPEHVKAAVTMLEELGCRRGRPLVREGFFPRFHYETEFVAGRAFPLRIDLHVRPFRPLRYARRVPREAFWQGAEVVSVGRGEVLVPSVEGMLIHLAAHSAIHANTRPMWLQDLKRWTDVWRERSDWERFLANVSAWGLTLPARQALERAEQDFGEVCPPEVHERLEEEHIGWRDRLALREAPRDAEHPVAHVLVNALCTPGWWFVLSYLRAVLVPDQRHMAEWYCRRHWGWLAWAHALRLVSPLLRRIPRLWARCVKIEIREGSMRGAGIFATRNIPTGELITHADGAARPNRNSACTLPGRVPARGRRQLAGNLRYLNHCCRPNSELCGSQLRALKTIDAGGEITIDYGLDACDCRRRGRGGNELEMSA